MIWQRAARALHGAAEILTKPRRLPGWHRWRLLRRCRCRPPQPRRGLRCGLNGGRSRARVERVAVDL